MSRMEAGTGRIEAGPLFSPGCPMGQVVRLRGIVTTSDTDTPENTRRYTGKKYRNLNIYLPRYRLAQCLFDRKFVET